MKKLALILVLLVGMTLSFAAIGLVMLFALKVVSNMDEVRDLLTGKMPGAESALVKPSEIVETQDALLLLQQQKQEIEQDLQDLQQDHARLQAEKSILSGELGELSAQNQAGNPDAIQAREERLAQLVALYDAMRPADAAAIMDGLSDELILEVLPRLKGRQAARILNNLGDDARKARLATMLVER